MAKEKAKPKSSKAEIEEDDFSEEEIDDYSEIDDDFSEEKIQKKKEANIFGKSYKWLEERYMSFSDWATEKGIGLNEVNDFLEEKGVPAFAFVSCFSIIILAILLFIIINFATKTTVEFSVVDYSGNRLSDVSIGVYDVSGHLKFTGVINDGYKKRLSLASGSTYKVSANKTGLADYENTITFERGTPLRVKFNEALVYGNLNLTVTDSQTNKAIEKYEAKLNYRENNLPQEVSGAPTSLGQISFPRVPQGKDLTLTIVADGYETTTQSIRLTNDSEFLTIPLEFDLSSAELQGVDARLIISASTESGDLLDDCQIVVYNNAGEIIGTDTTKLGKATFNVKVGQTIRFVVTKEGYRIFDSDTQEKTYRIIRSEETFFAKLVKGSSDLRVNATEDLVGPLDNVNVSLYNLSGNKLSEKTTLLDGQVIFTGLEKNTEYVVTACKENYLCSQYFANIDVSNNLDVVLVREGAPNTTQLSIYVYDAQSNPVTNAKVIVYRKFNEKYVPVGNGPLQVDLVGYVSIYTRNSETYRVIGIVGDSNASQEITIDPTKDNKVVLVIDEASRTITLELKDTHNNKVVDGYVTIKSKTGEILFEGYIDELPIAFQTKGYRDLIIEHMDNEGTTTTTSTTIGNSDKLVITLKPGITDYSPVISFVDLRDIYNNPTSVISIDKDYYLVFDVLLPIDAKSCGAHFRVGADYENDADGMSYGITGFKADTTTYRYSTTYNPGQQSIDTDNVGSPNEFNKWLELYWQSSSLSNKQVMIKVKANDIGKMPIKYRAWCDYYTNETYRDPTDLILNTEKNNSSRQALYAETKELSLNVLENAVECSNNLCIEYKFLDIDNFDYSKETFFAVKDNMYLLELNYYSVLNGELTIETQTDAARPIIGLVNYQDTEMFPSISLDSQDTKLSSYVLNISSGVSKKQYLLFKAKDIGVTYIDVKSIFNSLATEKRLSFEIKQKRNLLVNVPEILAYNSAINISVQDADNKTPINNAFVKLTDDYGEVISSTKTGKAGKYVINQNFSSSRPYLEVSAPGYISYTKQLIIADKGLIYAPESIDVVFGEGITQDSETITLVNKGNSQIKDLTYNITYIDEIKGLTTETQLPIALEPNKPTDIDVSSTIDPNNKFVSAKSILTIYGFVGNKQVAKEIEINYYRGQVKDDCLSIQPKIIYSYVGLSEGSENEITVGVVNNCKKQLIITPELLKAKGTTIKKDENLEIFLPSIIIEPNEEITDYTITVKNSKARTSTKSYAFEIAWRNPHYALPNTKLNVDLIDQSKTITVTPAVSIISLSQLMEQTAASNRTTFLITNTGKYPLRDIQISRLDEKFPSNIQDKIEPMSFSEIKPGQTKQIYIQYEGKVDKSSLASFFYKVTANAKGSKEPVEAKFTAGFNFSSAGCLDVDLTKISLYTKVGEEKVKQINVTNHCADAIGLVTYDKTYNITPNEFNQTFGEGTQVSLTPASSATYIAPMQTVPFYLKVKPTRYFTPRFENRITLLGIPISNTALSMVSSDPVWFSIEVEPPNADVEEDYQRVEQATQVKICGEEGKAEITTPKIVLDCKDDGYCDGESAAKFIASKVQELHKLVIDASNQIDNEINQTTCSAITARTIGCPISEILKSQQTKEFTNIPIYVQNDVVSDTTLRLVIKNEKEQATKYPTIKEYFVRKYVGKSTTSLEMAGTSIHIEDKIRGCGRYKITIDGAIAVKSQEKLDPQRAIFFVTIDGNKTDACEKNIANFRMYLPKDTTFFSKTNTADTWLTVISGDEKFGKPISKGVFNTEDRFLFRTEDPKKLSQLDVSIGEISENKNAIAKIYFDNLNKPTTPHAEKINIIINEGFKITSPNNNEKIYSQEFIDQTAGDIKKIIDGVPADVCVSKNRDYMLILSFEKEFGGLILKPQAENIQLSPLEKCMGVIVKSAVSENIIVKSEKINGVDIKFDYKGQKQSGDLSLSLEKDKDTDFNVCFLGDISMISAWSAQKIKLTAESKFLTSSGKINTERKADANITLLNYGLTPVDFLGAIQTTTDNIKTNELNTEKTIYAYIDWDNAYNKQAIEKYCDSLKKYNVSRGDKSTIFKKPDICDFEESKSEINARNDRALKRFASYLTGCTATCAALTTTTDLLWNLIPWLGQAKILSDIGWNCGLGCGIPAIMMYGKETGFTEKILAGVYKIPIVGDMIKFVGWVFEAIGGLFGGGSGPQAGNVAVGEASAVVHALARNGATTPMDTLVMPGANIPSTTPGPSINETLTIPGITPTGGGTGPTNLSINGKLGNLNIQPLTSGQAATMNETKLIKYLEYISRDPNADYWFYSKAGDRANLNRIVKSLGMSSATDRAAVRGLPKVLIEPTAQQRINAFYSLDPADQERFAKIIKKYSTKSNYGFTPRPKPGDNPANWIKPDGIGFADKIDKYISSASSSTTTYTITVADRITFLSQAQTTRTEIETTLKNVDSEISRLTATNPAAGSADDIALKSLQANRPAIHAQLNQVDDLIKDVTALSVNPTNPNLVDVTASVETKINNIANIKSELKNLDSTLKNIVVTNSSGAKIITEADRLALNNSLKQSKSKINQTINELDNTLNSEFSKGMPDSVKNPKEYQRWKLLTDNKAELKTVNSQMDDMLKTIHTKNIKYNSLGQIEVTPQLEAKINNLSTINNQIGAIDTSLGGLSKTTTVRQMTSGELDDFAKKVSKSSDTAAKKAKEIEAQMERLKKNKGVFKKIKEKELAKLQTQKEAFENASKSYQGVADDLKSIKGTSTAKTFDVPESTLTQYDDASKALTGIKLPGTFQKVFRTGLKLGVDWVIIAASNWSGEEYLNRLADEGRLAGQTYFEGIPINEFEKGNWYKATIVKGRSNVMNIVKEAPAVSENTIIKYKENNEIKELLTTEYQSELLQSSTPQKPAEEKSNTNVSNNLLELQKESYKQNLSKLQEYTECSFPEARSCKDLETVGLKTPLEPNQCSVFAQRVATIVYGITYNIGHACDSSTSNFGTKNKVIWDTKNNTQDEFYSNLIPGAIISIDMKGSRNLSCQPSHVVLYIGKNESGQDMVIHQLGTKVILEPFSNQFNLNPSQKGSAYQVVIPASGYALYNQYNQKVA